MDKLYPGISPTAASRMERIAGSYASMNNLEQIGFTAQLREARKRGTRAKAIKGKVEDDGTVEEPEDRRHNHAGTETEETPREQIQAGSAYSESSEHSESEDAGS